MTWHRAIVALGANLGDTPTAMRQAVGQLEALGQVGRVSRLYESAPVGGPDQPPFLNAVAEVSTLVQDPKAFLDGLHALEAAHGRVRDVRWGPRTLDLDLIAWDDDVRGGDVVLPHPRAAERRFVLQPLADIDPDFAFPDGRPVADLLPTVADQDLTVAAPLGWWFVQAPETPVRIVVAGPGRAGSAIGEGARLAGHRVVGVVSRSGNDGGLEAPVFAWGEPLPDCDLVLLTVPDRALLAAAASIVGALPEGAAVVHCSGITPLSVLDVVAGAGHPVGAFHPLASLSPGSGSEPLHGAGVAVAASDATTLARLEDLARSCVAMPFRIEDEQRAGYHAVASMASNHLTAVLGAAEEVAAALGLPFDRYRALASGAVAAAFNPQGGGPGAVLTGPVARGDEGTVALQRRAVEEATPELVPLLDALNEATRRLAGR